MKTNCSRCGGQDEACYVCKPEPEAAKEWPTREDIEELRVQAQELLRNWFSDYRGVKAWACINESSELCFIVAGDNHGIGPYLVGSGNTPEEAIEKLEKAVVEEDPVAKLTADADKLGFTLTKIEA